MLVRSAQSVIELQKNFNFKNVVERKCYARIVQNLDVDSVELSNIKYEYF